MTKTVRIENADSSTSYKVRVRPQWKNDATGKWEDAPPSDPPQAADYPTNMVTSTIHSHKRLIVEEY